MDTIAKSAGIIISGIVTEFILAMRRSNRNDNVTRATLLAFDPGTGNAFRADPSIPVMYISKETFLQVKRELETRAVRLGDSPPLLRQEMFHRPWFDIALDITDDYVLFRVHKVHDVREASV